MYSVVNFRDIGRISNATRYSVATGHFFRVGNSLMFTSGSTDISGIIKLNGFMICECSGNARTTRMIQFKEPTIYIRYFGDIRKRLLH